MVTLEPSELPSFHGHTKSIATHGAIPSERNSENSWKTPTHRTNEKIPTSRQEWLPSSLETLGSHQMPPSPSPSSPLQIARIIPEGAWTHLCATVLYLLPKRCPPGSPGSDSQWRLHSRVSQDHSKAKRNSSGAGSPLSSYTPGPIKEEAGKNTHLPISPRKAFNYILSQLPCEDLAFKQTASTGRCWLWSWSSRLRHRQVSAYPQLQGGTKSKGGWDNHKALRDNQELRPGWWTKFISYMRSLCQDWERQLFYLMHRNRLS